MAIEREKELFLQTDIAIEMKKKLIRMLPCLLLLSFLASCTEEMAIDAPEGKKVPVVEGSFTDEYKRHEVILSYTTPLYESEREMITNAKVYIIHGSDTIYYHEQEDKPGHYLTDSVAGIRRRRYHFEARVPDNTLMNMPLYMYADVYMPNNVERIDSLRLLPLLDDQGIPFVDESAAVCACPYFQTLSDTSIVYKVDLYLNNSVFKNRPSQVFQLFRMAGYAGYYFNGPEMLKDNVEVPIGIFNKKYMREGYVVKVKLSSITRDYLYFLYSQRLSIGANPIMGAFPANISNIFSNCDAIGWFAATSVVSAEAVYHEWDGQ